MQFRSKYFLKDREGDVRFVLRFLLFPRCFQGPYWRWLTTELLVERVCDVGDGEGGYSAWKWCEVGFANTYTPEKVDPPTPTPTPLSDALEGLVVGVADDLPDDDILEDSRLLRLEGFDDALIGVATRYPDITAVAYDRAKCISILMERRGISMEVAEELFEFNVVGAWGGDRTPIFITFPG